MATPDYRQQGLMHFRDGMMAWMSKESRAEYLTTFLETWHALTQAETLKMGHSWRVAGIFPGKFPHWAGDQQEYRAGEIYMDRFINEGNRYASKPAERGNH